MVKGSCLCGQINFELDGELQAPRYCHCENCRKFSGTSPAAAQCGSPGWFESKDFPEIVGIPLGVIDAGDVPPPETHLWVNSKPNWCAINDDLPRVGESP